MATIIFEVPAGLSLRVEGSIREAPIYDGTRVSVENPGVIVLLVERCDRLTCLRGNFEIDEKFDVVYDGAAQESRPLDKKGRCLTAVSKPGIYVLTISDPDLPRGGYA
jgi:hypothetical protein